MKNWFGIHKVRQI